MKAIIQRVSYSAVYVNNELINEINRGINVLIGFEEGDTEEKIYKIAKKIASLRIFDNFSKNIMDIDGEILFIPNFTLAGITKKGTKPNFQYAMKRETAKKYYDTMLKELNNYAITKGGIFGANMEVIIKNDGPISLILEV
ncbi:D-tyrosyl-tRNA(Tyr) deacylase [Lebetimonas natsushimae]|uniref:D-tyrosyl-tRNA(Tyr) deacylase n=1 Tax=Lebetimonas natsushimae TaxID=1936991 RepID=A0A292YGX8_9BACT|nr:D-aminoacyl-tRNA deacylase [Lebetimonas natsushimae]GAX88054.1 D-tyrosyl-tRNA(Tyr) deacylase [Lebetimonas natsushimae]